MFRATAAPQNTTRQAPLFLTEPFKRRTRFLRCSVILRRHNGSLFLSGVWRTARRKRKRVKYQLLLSVKNVSFLNQLELITAVSATVSALTEPSSAWLNNCVGHYNHRYFFSFCLFMTMGCVYCSISAKDMFLDAYNAIEVSLHELLDFLIEKS
ncbi:putative palmitoyltransferase ZDHHC16 [Labeo rohita]|uniref:Palmitoyltransferase n=1 Tax=Labeo rohita TaxID=84645 RepID=A0A498P3K9_LABRO|nr:putative palmitoyltransferase ZDHHC16 [Labeo rohita]